MEKAFDSQAWDRIVETVGNVFGFSEERKARFKEAKVPRLIAAIPFVAGCSHAMRTAITHCAAYVIADKSEEFDHGTEDAGDPYSRFRPIMNFVGGQPELIAAGMGRIGLVSYGDHLRDSNQDLREGKFNPINEGQWNEGTREFFESEAKKAEVPAFEEIIPVENALKAWWDW